MPDKPLTRQEQFRAMSKLLLDCMYDRELHQRLLNDPKGTLASVGFELLPESKVFVHENKLNEHHIVVPYFFESPLKTATLDHPLLPTEEELQEIKSRSNGKK
jgi:hypothetical protein